MIKTVLFFLACCTFATYQEIASSSQSLPNKGLEKKRTTLNNQICRLVRKPIISIADCSKIHDLYCESLLLRHKSTHKRISRHISEWLKRKELLGDIIETYQTDVIPGKEREHRKMQIILWNTFKDSLSSNLAGYTHLNEMLKVLKDNKEAEHIFHSVQTVLAKRAPCYQDYLHITHLVKESELSPYELNLFTPYLNTLALHGICNTTNPCKASITHRKLQIQAHQLRSTLDSIDNYQQLINTLEELKNYTSPLSPEYKKLDDEITYVLRSKYYFAGDYEKLVELKNEETDAQRKAYTQNLIHRLEQEYYLAGIVHNEPKNSSAIRSAHLELMTTYEKHDPNYEKQLNKICRIDIEGEIEKIAHEPSDPITFYTKMYQLNRSLAQVIPSESAEQEYILSQIERLKPYMAYVEHYFAVETALTQPLSQAQAQETYALLMKLHDLATPLYAQDARAIPMAWIDEQLTTYAEYCFTYERVAAIQDQPNSLSFPEISTAIKKMMDKPIIDDATKKDLQEILKNRILENIKSQDDSPEGNRNKIFLIQDNLLKLSLLSPNERISWNNRLAVHLITKKIHATREELKRNPENRVRLNKELAALLAERETAKAKLAPQP